MKTTLYYFTGTGNSLWVARELAAKISSAEVVPMARLITNFEIFAESERIGFVFPLYYWGLPKIVADFIKRIDLGDGRYIFFIVVPGEASSSKFVGGKIRSLLKRKGQRLNAGFQVQMPGNYIKMYDNESPEVQTLKYREAFSTIARIAEAIVRGERNEWHDKNGFIAALVNHWWRAQVNRSDRDFCVTDACNSCGMCVKVCPVMNISLEQGNPVWDHRCQECMACIHFCPQLAIQTKESENRGRYRHPDVTIQEIITR